MFIYLFIDLLVVYSTTLSVEQIYTASNYKMLSNNGSERIWKEAAVA
jgi:hypothetical protein